jgi:hypothetical protein
VPPPEASRSLVRRADPISAQTIPNSASISFWFRVELIYLSDRVFLSLNETSFRNKVQAGGGAASTVTLQWSSSADIYKVFVYSGSRSLPDGRMSREAIDAFPDLEELKECRFYSAHLWDQFYTIVIVCW